MRFSILLILTLAAAAFAQSGRVAGNEQSGSEASEPTIKAMFEEVNAYVKTKANEYAAKKVPYSNDLLEQTKKDQRSLAARYAAAAQARKEISTEDRYYIGMLHWVAMNLDGTVENLTKFFSAADADAPHAQTARSIVVVSLAKQKKIDAAEKLLVEYAAKEPTKLTERVRMEGEIAKALRAQDDPTRMAPHAEAAFALAKELLKAPESTSRGLDEIVDSGMLVFEAYSGPGQRDKAEAALDELRSIGVSSNSPSLYFYAIDHKIRYLIDTDRKAQALDLYNASLKAAATAFADKTRQDDVLRRLKDRQKHYSLLGARAPEFLAPQQVWLPGTQRTIDDLKGKVVLFDFWAMWCAPCIDALPELKEWRDEFRGDGFEILGLTRYYGASYGYPADHVAELAMIKGFREKYAIPYDIVVSDGQAPQILYGAMMLPTAVLIDRKGTVRYVASGTSPSRTAELREMIVKLLAEK